MTLNEIDQWIRSGRSREAKVFLQEHVRRRHGKSLSRAELAVAAGLCRRSGWPEGGIILLNAVVRAKARKTISANASECIEYARCLAQVGLLEEARTLLRAGSATNADALLVEAISYFSTWDYAASLPLLRRYVSQPELADYPRLIGNVNLVAAMVMMHDKEALDLLRQLCEKCERGGHSLLLGNLFEIQAQNEIRSGNWNAAKQFLDKANDLLREHAGIDKVYLLKWQTILDMRRDGPSAESLAKMATIVAHAQELRHWETWRDCDFHTAAIMHDHGRLDYVYCGTPFLEYRRRIEAEIAYKPKSHFIWQVGGKGRSTWHLHIECGTKMQGCEPLKPGQVRQRLLSVLASDFYRPFTIPMLSAALFPGRYYNPHSSPAVVHQAMKRLRAWIDELGVPLVIRETGGAFRLTATAPVKIEIPNSEGAVDWRCKSEESLLQTVFARLEFTSKEFASQFSISPRAANRRIASLLQRGLVIQLGSGPKTRFTSPKACPKEKK